MSDQSDYFRREFKKGNPLMAWRALLWARQTEVFTLRPSVTAEKREIPEWVLDYLETCASNLIDLSALENAKRTTDAHIVQAIGLKSKGRSTAMRRDRDAVRNQLIVQLVTGLYLAGMPVGKAHEEAAREWGTSAHNIKTIFQKSGRKLPPR